MNQTPPPDQYPQTQPPRTIRVAAPNVKPYVTYAILGFTIFIYLLQVASQYLFSGYPVARLLAFFHIAVSNPGGFDFVALLGEKINELIRSGQIWRLITP